MITLWILSIITTIILYYRFKKEVKNGTKKPIIYDNDMYVEGFLLLICGIISFFGTMVLIITYLP